MNRWQPDSRDRMRAAALELYVEHGFEQTTVADIAAAVGLTERTFFRHFADKREVLFEGQEVLAQAFASGIAGAAPGETPMGLVAAALDAAAQRFFPDERRSTSRRRQQVIDANPGLAERELLKMGVLGSALAAGLREHGVPEPAATLAAESGITVFRIAFAQWLAEGEERDFESLQREVLAELVAVSRATRR